jgi:hypothetical protein
MNDKKIYRKGLITLLVVIVIAIATIIVYSSDKPFETFGGFMILCGSIAALMRSYNLENYLRLQDNKETVTFIEHFKGMWIALFNMDVQKPMVLYILIKPILKKGDFETVRKKVNLFTYMTYSLIIIGIVIMNIDKN